MSRSNFATALDAALTREPAPGSVDSALAYIAGEHRTWAGLLLAARVLAAEVERLRGEMSERTMTAPDRERALTRAGAPTPRKG